SRTASEREARSEMHPRALAVDGSGNIEIELQDRRNQEQSGAGALVARLIQDPLAVRGGDATVHEDVEADPSDAERGREGRAELGGQEEALVPGKRARAHAAQARAAEEPLFVLRQRRRRAVGL